MSHVVGCDPLAPTLKLIGLTRAGRNHVRGHGDRWRRIARADEVQFDPRPGPWLLLESMAEVEAGKGLDSFLLWVHGDEDADHRIV